MVSHSALQRPAIVYGTAHVAWLRFLFVVGHPMGCRFRRSQNPRFLRFHIGWVQVQLATELAFPPFLLR